MLPHSAMAPAPLPRPRRRTGFRLPALLSLVAVFALLFITYILLAIGEFSGAAAGSGITSIGGWIGILTAIAAWYTALAGILRAVSGGKLALPVVPMS